MISLVFLILGIVVGIICKNLDRLKKMIEKLLGYSILALMLCIGISMGIDKAIFSEIGTIGFVSVVFAVITSIFSVLAVYLLTLGLVRKKNK